MAATSTQILLPQTQHQGTPGTVTPITGNAVPAAAYFKSGNDLQTITYSLTGATGNITIQATLASQPTEADWFTTYVFAASATTTTSFQNIPGNFVYVRATIPDFSSGTVNFIKMSY